MYRRGTPELGTVDSGGVDDVLGTLDAEGVPAADVGEVTAGEGLVVDGDPTDHPGADPFWAAFEEYMGKLEGESESDN